MASVSVLDGYASSKVMSARSTAQECHHGKTHVESSDMEVVAELGVPGTSEGVEMSGGGRFIRVGALAVICAGLVLQ